MAIQCQATEEELASMKKYLDSGANKEAPLGNLNFFLVTIDIDEIERYIDIDGNPHWDCTIIRRSTSFSSLLATLHAHFTTPARHPST